MGDKKDGKCPDDNVTREPIKNEPGNNSGASDDGTHTTSGDSGHQRDILSNSPKSQTEDQLDDEFGKATQDSNGRPYDIFKTRNKDVDVTSDRGSSEESIIDGKERMDTSNTELDTSKTKTKYRRGANTKKIQNKRSASIEKVPITINSHIPASPERLISQQKTITHDTGTQIENAFEDVKSNRVSDDSLVETNATISSVNDSGHTKPI